MIHTDRHSSRCKTTLYWQINFLQMYKRPSLDVLLKHMPKVEALRFLHDVVDLSQLEYKLKHDFSGDGEKVMEQVCMCVCVRVGEIS